MKPVPWRRGFTLSLLVAATLACGIRSDEFDCENAFARLVHCCGGQSPAFGCTYVNGGCNGTTVYPLDPSESECILASSCDDLRSSGVCDRAAEAYTSGVCPPGPLPDVQDSGPVSPVAQCAGPTDCPAGYVCCTYPSVGSGIYEGTTCVETLCGGSGIEVCMTSADCADGGTCASTALVAPGHCVAAADASSAEPEDDDGAVEATPEGDVDGEEAAD